MSDAGEYQRPSRTEMLQHVMDESGLSIEDIGRIIGRPSIYVMSVLSGQQRLSEEDAKKLADHFRVGVSLFYEGDGDSASEHR